MFAIKHGWLENMEQIFLDIPDDDDKFVDRSEIRTFVINEIEHKIQKEEYFKIISIYGMGGIGKSCLLNEIENQVSQLDKAYRFLSISFEIESNRQYIENLIKICDAYDKPCILFSYAAMLYWEKTSILQLNTKFMKKLQDSFLTDFIDAINQVAAVVLPANMEFPALPAISDILKCTGEIIQLIRNTSYFSIMKKLRKLSSSELLDRLPVLLGMDIDHNEYEGKQQKPLICLFDSYQQSIPYSESVEWLRQLISTIHKGLFIVTSREKLLWTDKENDIYPYELKCYPEEEARNYLSEYIRPKDADFIDLIIASTQCVPIYIKLAIDIYQREILHNLEDLDKSLFQDREALAVRFINHFVPNWQEVIMNLAVIRIFNKEIFSYIVQKQNLNCPLHEYHDIVNVSLIQYIENTNSLVKIHDVFCNNVVKILNGQQKIDILSLYLNYVLYRQPYILGSDQIGILLTLFINILQIEIDFSRQLILQTDIIEKTLDLFFLLSNVKVTFTPIEPTENKDSNVNQMLCLINAIFYKNKSTQKAIKYLEHIKNPKELGYHEKSFHVFSRYTFSLTGDYASLKKSLKNYNDSLTDKDKPFWYYMQIKLYSSDFLLMEGNFIDSYQILADLEKQLDNTIFSVDTFFQIQRQKGHVFRFNLYMDKAFEEYEKVFTYSETSDAVKGYIYTNMIEAKCYFSPQFVEENFETALAYVESEKQIKNKGKLYYARAISNIVNKKYDLAADDIQQSIVLNRQDGYQSGELFALMAQAYLEYACHNELTENTSERIHKLLADNKVYNYFNLPLSIMKGIEKQTEHYRTEYQWVDFDHTLKQYNVFFKNIRNE